MNHTKDRVQYPSAAEELNLIHPLNKGLSAISGPLSSADIPKLGWNLLREDLSLPTAVLYEEKLQHNLKWMQSVASAYCAKLAPHGKTTMAPKLFARQIQAGAWGITLATAHQTLVAYSHGVRRVLMANELVGKQNLEIVSRLLEDDEFEYFCLVDSAAQVEMLGSFFKAHGQRLNVLLEVGAEDGRTGVRDQEQVQATTAALVRWKSQLRLCGVEVYEGVLSDEAAIRRLLEKTVEIARQLSSENRFDRRPVILTGAGSAWYDVVADIFAKADIGQEKELILRPGCYLTHDVGAYRAAQQRILKSSTVARNMGSNLEPALQIWGYVQSVPEAEKAIINFGRRDVAFDAGLPVPVLHFRPGSAEPVAPPESWKLTRIMDQHSFLHFAAGDDVRLGDMIAFDISHPCTTFDKWRYLPVLDSEYRVIDIVQTFF
ncbi:MAG TPA: amino acid deaminase [Terriglobales bacterium]|jgi:D-serine dehydratase|nr:amino acid deaminase [Terriglobales bacterium]